VPSIAQYGPYRLFFYAAKIWLDPVILAQSGGFGRKEISEVLDIVSQHEESILRSWNEFFEH
jgi:hypothetical protein